MAAAAREKLRADFGLSTTGVAGPDSLEGKPPGLVYIGLADSRGKGSWRQNYLPHREEVKRRTAVAALFRLRERVIELP
jgi:nicotinamide-nucleotide amidase